MSSFDQAFDALMKNEGGYSNHPDDPGGATMWGVTERVARANGYAGGMQDLTQDAARRIAKTQYWDAVRGDELPQRLAFEMLDAAYNTGSSRAIAWLQQSLRISPDGIFGPQTMAAVKGAPDLDKVIGRYDAWRLLFLANLDTWPTFGRGWARRIAGNLLESMA